MHARLAIVNAEPLQIGIFHINNRKVIANWDKIIDLDNKDTISGDVSESSVEANEIMISISETNVLIWIAKLKVRLQKPRAILINQ